MPEPTNPCGCSGTWDVTYTFFGNTYHEYVAGYESDNPYLKTIAGKDYLYSACDDRDMRDGLVWVDVPGQAPIVNTSFVKSDPSCGVSGYDCINGACVPSSTYSTLGVFSSLEACQTQCSANGNCGSGKVCADSSYCPPGKVCIEQVEYSEIQGLISQLSSDLS